MDQRRAREGNDDEHEYTEDNDTRQEDQESARHRWPFAMFTRSFSCPPNTRDQLRRAHGLTLVHDDPADDDAPIRIQPPFVSCITLFGGVASTATVAPRLLGRGGRRNVRVVLSCAGPLKMTDVGEFSRPSSQVAMALPGEPPHDDDEGVGEIIVPACVQPEAV